MRWHRCDVAAKTASASNRCAARSPSKAARRKASAGDGSGAGGGCALGAVEFLGRGAFSRAGGSRFGLCATRCGVVAAFVDGAPLPVPGVVEAPPQPVHADPATNAAPQTAAKRLTCPPPE